MEAAKLKSNATWAGITYRDLSLEQKNFLTLMLDDMNSGNFRNITLRGCAGSGKTIIACHAKLMLKKALPHLTFDMVVYTKLLKKFISDGSEEELFTEHDIDETDNMS